MKNYTVIGFYEESHQLFSHHVKAVDSKGAFALVSKAHSDAVFTAVLDGTLNEGDGIEFPGTALVDAETVLSQPEVFGTGEPLPFSEIDNDDFIDWLALAREIAEDRGTPIDEDDSPEAERQAEQHYLELNGVLPQSKSPIQDLANDLAGDLKKTTVKLSGETKTVTVTLAGLTRLEYSEDVKVPVEFDGSMLEALTDKAYEDVDGGDYFDDPDYWEKGDCHCQEAE